MKSLLLITSIFFTFNISAHCPMMFPLQGLCADIEWQGDSPKLDVPSHFILKFWKKGDKTHTPVSPKRDLDIYTYMIMDADQGDGGHHHHHNSSPAPLPKAVGETPKDGSICITRKNNHRGGIPMTWIEVQPGVFEIKDAIFYMGGMKGYWQVRVDMFENKRLVATGIYEKVDFNNEENGHEHHNH